MRSFKILERINVHEKVMSDAFLVWKNFNIRNGTAKGLTIDYVFQMHRVATRAVWDVQLLVNKNNNLNSIFFLLFCQEDLNFLHQIQFQENISTSLPDFTHWIVCVFASVIIRVFVKTWTLFVRTSKIWNTYAFMLNTINFFLFFCIIFEKRKKFCTIEDTKSFFFACV